MTDITNESTGDAGVAPDAPTVASAQPNSRKAQVAPVLETLFELYPQLFGARFLPLKLGVFQELLAAHPDRFEPGTLKLALGVHTRSTRYLQCVAAGLKRHDLQGQPVDEVAPEHVFASIAELYLRQQRRPAPVSPVKLRQQLMAAFDRSGLSRQDYLLCIGTPPAALQAALEEAIDQLDLQRAKRAALQKSFTASGKSEQAFADMVGMSLREVKAALKA